MTDDLKVSKLTTASPYTWTAREGSQSNFSVAAKYGVFRDGVQVALIERTSGGGYMEPTGWTAWYTTPDGEIATTTWDNQFKREMKFPARRVLAQCRTKREATAKAFEMLSD